MGTQTSPAEPKFFVCVVNHTTFRQLSNSRFSPNLVIKRILVSRHRMWKDILENLNFMGHFPQKSEIENWSNRHLTQSRLQVTGCTAERCCLLHVVVQEIYQLFLRPTVAELRGIKSCPIFRFGLLCKIKPLKRTFR